MWNHKFETDMLLLQVLSTLGSSEAQGLRLPSSLALLGSAHAELKQVGLQHILLSQTGYAHWQTYISGVLEKSLLPSLHKSLLKETKCWLLTLTNLCLNSRTVCCILHSSFTHCPCRTRTVWILKMLASFLLQSSGSDFPCIAFSIFLRADKCRSREQREQRLAAEVDNEG
jgi:hypothetical protein